MNPILTSQQQVELSTRSMRDTSGTFVNQVSSSLIVCRLSALWREQKCNSHFVIFQIWVGDGFGVYYSFLIHKASIAQKHLPGMGKMCWTLWSPDLNESDHSWDLLKKAAGKWFRPNKTVKLVQGAIQTGRHSLCSKSDYCQSKRV